MPPRMKPPKPAREAAPPKRPRETVPRPVSRARKVNKTKHKVK